MFKRKLVALLGILFITSCVTYRFKLGNAVYSTSAAAINAARIEIANQLSAIEPKEHPFPLRARVIIPNMERIKAEGVIKKGNPSQIQVDYVATVLYLGYMGMADAVKKRNIFSEVSIEETYDTYNPPMKNEDVLIWLHLIGQRAQWYMKSKESKEKIIIPIDLTLTGASKILSFLKGIENNLRKMNISHKQVPNKDVEKTHRLVAIGTGFVVSHDGYILTNYHVVKECKSIRMVANDQKKTLSLIAVDSINDLALLKDNSKYEIIATFSNSNKIDVGQNIVVVGYPLSGILAEQLQVTTGIISAPAGIGNDSRFLQITAPVQQGNSGGPLLDEYGHVVGIVTSTLNASLIQKITGDIPQNVNFAIKAILAKIFLTSHNVKFITKKGGRRPAISEIAKQAKKYSFKLQCWN